MKKGTNSNASDEMRPEYDLPELKFVCAVSMRIAFAKGTILCF